MSPTRRRAAVPAEQSRRLIEAIADARLPRIADTAARPSPPIAPPASRKILALASGRNGVVRPCSLSICSISRSSAQNGSRPGRRRSPRTSRTPIRPATGRATSRISRRRSTAPSSRCARPIRATSRSRNVAGAHLGLPETARRSETTCSLEQELIKAGEVSRDYALERQHREVLPPHVDDEREGVNA